MVLAKSTAFYCRGAYEMPTGVVRVAVSLFPSESKIRERGFGPKRSRKNMPYSRHARLIALLAQWNALNY